MSIYLTWFIGAFALGAFGVWSVRQCAISRNWLDHPNERSFHQRPTPRLGGLGMLFPTLVAIPGILILGVEDAVFWIILLLPGLFISLVSCFDDRYDLPRLVRFSSHLLSGCAILFLFRENWWMAPIPLFGDILPPLLVGTLLLVWMAGLTNAYNFMDGIDGIAAVQGLIALLGWASVLFAASHSGEISTAGQVFIGLALVGGLLGFLILNWSPASIFMGDIGSTFLGFYLAALPFALPSVGVPFARALEAGVFFTWPFVFDAAMTFCRRVIRRENVFEAHRSHLYQTLAATFPSREAGHRWTTLLFGLLALLGVALYWTNGPLWAKLSVLAWVWIAVAFWTFGLRNGHIKKVSDSTSPKAQPEHLHNIFRNKPLMSFEIFLSPPQIGEAERKRVQEALDSGFIAPVGPQLHAFEEALSEYLGLPHMQAVSSGTAAIHLGLRALGVGPGDCVICPDLTFVASVNPVRYLGAEPVLVDVSADNWALNPTLVKRAIRELKGEGRTVRAMVIVHAFGIPAPMEALMAIANEEGVAVLEDCAGAFGTRFGNRSVGRHGAAATFSFNGNKVLTTSGGGALYLKDAEQRRMARIWANQGRDPDKVGYAHDSLGYNYKLSNISAAIGLGQLETVHQRLERKAAIYREYRERLAQHEGLTFQPEPAYGTNNYWLSTVGIPSGFDVSAVISGLRERGIEAAPMWNPMHLQALNTDLRVYGGEVSERIFLSSLSLPCGPALTTAQIEYIVGQLEGLLIPLSN